MATKIFYNDNRIIIDGHADSAEECKAITAMCDEMANSENFKTIVYENGHAVFEQISGGESEMFSTTETRLAGIKQCECKLDEYLKTSEARGIYLTQVHAASIYATKTLLNDAINEIKSTLGTVDPSTQGSVAQQLSTLNSTVNSIRSEVDAAIQVLADDIYALGEHMKKLDILAGRIDGLEHKATKSLPYTADELIAKLESI